MGCGALNFSDCRRFFSKRTGPMSYVRNAVFINSECASARMTYRRNVLERKRLPPRRVAAKCNSANLHQHGRGHICAYDARDGHAIPGPAPWSPDKEVLKRERGHDEGHPATMRPLRILIKEQQATTTCVYRSMIVTPCCSLMD